MKIRGNTVSTPLNPKKINTLGEKYFIYSGDNLHYGYTAAGRAPIQTKYTEFDTTDTISYRFKVTYADGFKEIIDTTFKDVVGITAADVSSKSERLANILVSPVNGDMHFMSLNGQETDYIEALDISLTSGEPIHVPIDAKLVPVDNETIKVNKNGKIYSTASAPGVTEADNGQIMQVVDGVWSKVSLDDSAIKTYIDAYISSAIGGDY